MRRSVCVSLCGISLLSAATPAPETQRLVDLAKLYVTVEYFDPVLTNSGKDWNAAFLSALTSLRTAEDGAALQSAASRLLNEFDGTTPMAVNGKPWMASRFHHGLETPGTHFYSGILLRNGSRPTTTLMLGKARVDVQTSVPDRPLSGTVNDKVSDQPYPSENERILACFRLWGAVRYFFAHKDSLDEDWDALLGEYLPKLIAAQNAREYHLLIAEWVSHLSDSMSGADSSELTEYFGRAHAPVQLRLLNKKPVVTAVGPDAAKAGLRTGDLIVRVDGENVVDRIKREANYLSASTPASLSELVAAKLLDGPAEKPLELQYVRGDGRPVTIRISRNDAPVIANSEKPTSDSIYYFNLAGADSVPKLPASARAIVFDLRGDSEFDPAQLCGQLEGSAGSPAYLLTAPIAVEPDVPQPGLETNTASDFQLVSVPKLAGLPSLATQVVVLVDARTRGNSERAALMLLAGGKARSVGATTAGAAGQAARLFLPGGITVHFSGEDLRLLNGAPLQRQGLTPYLPVAVTQAGVRAGRDEPLEAALHAVTPK